MTYQSKCLNYRDHEWGYRGECIKCDVYEAFELEKRIKSLLAVCDRYNSVLSTIYDTSKKCYGGEYMEFCAEIRAALDHYNPLLEEIRSEDHGSFL